MRSRILTVMMSAVVLASPWGSAQPRQEQKPAVDLSKTPPPPADPRQQPRQAQKPGEGVIRAFTDLVLIDVQVNDKNGNPVKGLKPEHFQVFENGKAQKISSFDYFDVERIETAAGEDQSPIVLSLGQVAEPERVREVVRDRRMTVLFFDMTSMQNDEVLRATDEALKFVRHQMSPADLVAALVFANRLTILAPFTNDKELLARAMHSLRPGKESQLATAEGATPTGEEAVTQETGAAFTADDTEFNIFNTDRKLAAIESVAEMLRSIPGKKAVIQFAGGITQTGEENRSQLRAATDAANRANVSLYTVDTRGLQAAAPGGNASEAAASGTALFSGAAVRTQTASRQESRDTLATLAADTGGESFFDVGDFKEVFQKVQQDGTGYYLVGYYSEDLRRDGKWRNVRVRVNASGARVHYREGYYAPKDYNVYTTEDRERQLDEAMRAEAPRVELAVALETAQFRIGKDEIFVPVAAKLASSALEWAKKRGKLEAQFDFLLEVRDTQFNRPAAALRDTMKVKLQDEAAQEQQKALVYQGGVILGPGNYRIKFLARDNESGRVGTFEQNLTLPAAREEKLELSSVLLSSQIEPVRASGAEVERKGMVKDAKLKQSPLEIGGERVIPSVTRVFTTQQNLYVLFQAYVPQKADAAKLRAGLVFFRQGQRISETPMVEAAGFDPKTRTAVFRMSLPLETFAIGRYTAQAVVIEAGGSHAAFARSHFALRTPPAAQARKASTTSGSGT
jgi:VWFA-related protein